MSDSEGPAPGRPSTQSAGNRPLLLVVGDGSAPAPDERTRRVLGLTLEARARLAARRAGYAGTIVAGGDQSPAAAIADAWTEVAGEPTGRLVIVPANALAEVGWLKAAARAELPAGGWGQVQGRVIVVGAEALNGAAAPTGGAGIGELDRHLAAHLGPARDLPAAAAPMRVHDAGDLPAARRRLLKALVKDTDGFMARHVERPISIAITRWLAETPITPNQMTLVSVAFGLAGAPFFLSASPVWQTVGALLFLWHSILDGCDGELARLKFRESRWGGVLDYWGDNVVHVAIFACMAIGWADAVGAGWPLILGAAAVGGTIGSASWVYLRTMRGGDGEGPLYTSVGKAPSAGLTRLLDSASRRDFIYLVVAAALFGKASWFLVMAAVGAPVFFTLLLVAAARETKNRSPSAL